MSRGIPAPAAERLLDADDDDARVHQSRLQRAIRADRGGDAPGRIENQAGGRRRQLPSHSVQRRRSPRRAHLGADLVPALRGAVVTKALVIIPTYNERENIESLVDA